MRRSPFGSLTLLSRAVLGMLVVLVAASGCGPVRAKPDDAVAAPPVEHSRYLVLRLKERRLYLMSSNPGHAVESFPIAVGRKGKETPTGTFAIDEMLENPEFPKLDPKDKTRVLKLIPPGPDNPLGARWMTFIRGDGWTIGIHGTPRPELLGQAVSGGCIRMRNADVIRVYDQVKLGTKVVVEP